MNTRPEEILEQRQSDDDEKFENESESDAESDVIAAVAVGGAVQSGWSLVVQCSAWLAAVRRVGRRRRRRRRRRRWLVVVAGRRRVPQLRRLRRMMMRGVVVVSVVGCTAIAIGVITPARRRRLLLLLTLLTAVISSCHRVISYSQRRTLKLHAQNWYDHCAASVVLTWSLRPCVLRRLSNLNDLNTFCVLRFSAHVHDDMFHLALNAYAQ